MSIPDDPEIPPVHRPHNPLSLSARAYLFDSGRVATLSPAAFVVYEYLLSLTDPNDPDLRAIVSKKSIGERCGLSDKTVSRSLDELVDDELVYRSSHPDYRKEYRMASVLIPS